MTRFFFKRKDNNKVIATTRTANSTKLWRQKQR